MVYYVEGVRDRNYQESLKVPLEGIAKTKVVPPHWILVAVLRKETLTGIP